MSVHPVAAAATGEAIAEVLEALGTSPDLALVVASGTHQASLEQITDAVRHTLSPSTLLACGAQAALAGHTVAAGSGAVLIWAARHLTITPWSLHLPHDGSSAGLAPRPATTANVGDLPHTGTLVVLANDPGTFDGARALLRSHRPDLMVVGGLLSPATRLGITSGDTQVGPAVRAGGTKAGTGAAVGFVIGPDGGGRPERTGVSGVASAPLARPIGSPLAVTAVDEPPNPAGGTAVTLLTGLAGRPALDEVDRLLASLSPDDRELAADHIALGRVVNHHATDFNASDLESLGVRGVATARRAVAIEADVTVGSVVQFLLPDPSHAAAIAARAATTAMDHPAPGMLLLCTDLSGITPPADSPDMPTSAEGGQAGVGCLAVVGGPAGQSVVHAPGIAALALG